MTFKAQSALPMMFKVQSALPDDEISLIRAK